LRRLVGPPVNGSGESVERGYRGDERTPLLRGQG